MKNKTNADAARDKYDAAINAASRKYTAAASPHCDERARARAAANAILCDADVAYRAKTAPHFAAYNAAFASARAEYDAALTP